MFAAVEGLVLQPQKKTEGDKLPGYSITDGKSLLGGSRQVVAAASQGVVAHTNDIEGGLILEKLGL